MYRHGTYQLRGADVKEYNTYEDAKKRLEEITAEISGRNISLDKSIELYDEAVKLTSLCYQKLKNAELKITKISANEPEELP